MYRSIYNFKRINFTIKMDDNMEWVQFIYFDPQLWPFDLGWILGIGSSQAWFRKNHGNSIFWQNFISRMKNWSKNEISIFCLWINFSWDYLSEKIENFKTDFSSKFPWNFTKLLGIEPNFIEGELTRDLCWINEIVF